MKRIDAIHLEYPFAGARMLRDLLQREGVNVGRRSAATRMAQGWVYRCAIVDWASRRVLAHRISITMEADFCIEALEEAFAKYGQPEIFNTDQGSQFSSLDFTSALKARHIEISMDGRGSWRDNVFAERLWKSVKYEEVYLHAYESVSQAKAGIGRYLDSVSGRRQHLFLNYAA